MQGYQVITIDWHRLNLLVLEHPNLIESQR
jgi:hypothetical protein